MGVVSEFFIEQGWLIPARRLLSPNYNQRPADVAVDCLIIHNISLPPGQFGGAYVDQLFTNQLDPSVDPFFAQIADLRVSAHLLIERDGAVTQFVNLNDRAWHAGVSEWQGRSNCNDYAIGIELEGTDELAYTAQQYRQLSAITVALLHAYPQLSLERIIGHVDVAPERKTDPGSSFDWRGYRQQLRTLASC